MIDIHSHIIYGVDDGPKTKVESMELLKEASSQGVTKIIATPHRRKGMFETPNKIIKENFIDLKKSVEAYIPNLQIYLGNELFCTEDIFEKIENKQIFTMNNTQYLLVEFNYSISFKDMTRKLREIILLGYSPIIAHIERYKAVEYNEKYVKKLIEMGCYIQVNAESILPKKLFKDAHKIFKNRAEYLLKKDLIHIIASDMHNLDNRKPKMKEAYNVILKKYGAEQAKIYFEENPLRVLKGEEI